MPRSKGRTGRPWRRLQRAVLAESTICWLCGHEIDLTLPHTDRMSATVDHVVPLAMGGAPRGLENLRPAHRACNSRKGKGLAQPAPRTSRRW